MLRLCGAALANQPSSMHKVLFTGKMLYHLTVIINYNVKKYMVEVALEKES